MKTKSKNARAPRLQCENFSSTAAVFSLLLLLPLAARGGGVVTNCTEADLRAALTGGGTVTFACDGIITLANQILIAADTVLDGSGHQVAISGGGQVRVFAVNSGINLTILGLEIIHGLSTNVNSG